MRSEGRSSVQLKQRRYTSSGEHGGRSSTEALGEGVWLPESLFTTRVGLEVRAEDAGQVHRAGGKGWRESSKLLSQPALRFLPSGT